MADLIRMKAEIIGKDHDDDALECMHEVVKEWMSNAPNISSTYKCTWKGLCELLDDARVGKVSADLQEACSFMQWT